MICRGVLLLLSMSATHGISCDFKYIERDPLHPDPLIERAAALKALWGTTSLRPTDAFECEENEDDQENSKSASLEKVTVPVTTTRLLRINNSSPQDEFDYEDVESSCQVTRRTIQPKALNNIYNKLTKVVNTASFIQSINIEQCLRRTEPCNSGIEPPRGKKQICRQKHVRITLKALKHKNGPKIVDEDFYYPSHCICELVTLKQRKWHGRKRKRSTKTELFKGLYYLRAAN